MITTKQMLKGYRDGSFGGGTGPSIQCLDKRKRARNDSILTKILQGNSSYENAKNECSPPRKKKKKEKKGTRKISYHRQFGSLSLLLQFKLSKVLVIWIGLF